MPEDGPATSHAAPEARLPLGGLRVPDLTLARPEEAGIPGGPIDDIGRVREDPRARRLGMARPVPHARPGEAGVGGSPLTLAGRAPGIRRPVPALGEHAPAIPAEAGLTTNEIAALRAAGAGGE